MPDALLQALLTHGLAGLVAALFVWLYLHERKEHKSSHERFNAEREKLTQELQKTHLDAAKKEQRLIEERAVLEKDYLEQLGALRDSHAARERACLQTVEYFAKSTVEAVEELGQVAVILRNRHDR